jgi:ElaB/YqjD/DUF883 family membrane-anchored ribosome-binding protein
MPSNETVSVAKAFHAQSLIPFQRLFFRSTDMTDEDRAAEDAQSAVRDAAGMASDKVRELSEQASKTIRGAADQASQTAKEGLKLLQDSVADMNLRESLTRQPWITVAVAFAVGFVAGQIIRRPSQ